jgi:probable F420-dependent oxidoreductase
MRLSEFDQPLGQFEVHLFHFSTTIGPPLADIARMADKSSLDGIFVPEHTHFPTDGLGFSDPNRQPLDERYRQLFDPFLTLTALAVASERITLGTAICQITHRDPIVTAKEVATIDQLSGGRFRLGAGSGWHPEQNRNHGIDPDRRLSSMLDRLQTMRSLWTDEVAESTAAGSPLSPSWQWPKPVQRPHPPIYLGGNGPRTMAAALDLGIGWMPTFRGDTPVARVEQMASLARERDAGLPQILVIVAEPDLEQWMQLRDAGVQGVIVRGPHDDQAALAEFVDRCTQLRSALQLTDTEETRP